MIRYAVVLGLICLVASSLLAGVNSLTRPKIIAQAKAAEESSLKEVLPAGVRFEPIKSEGDILYYKACDDKGKLVGVAFKTSGKGYSSTIETMVGMKIDGTINAIKILNQNETPGLGTRVVEPAFIRQFLNRNIRGLDEVQAITGATVSSTAVIDSVKEKAQEIKILLKSSPD